MRSSGTYIRLALSLLVATGVLELTAQRTFFMGTVTTPFFAVAIVSVLAILLRTRLSWGEPLGVVVLTGVLAGIDFGMLGYAFSWQAWCSFVGLASFMVLTFRVIWAAGEECRRAGITWVATAFLLASGWLSSWFLNLTEKAHPYVLDLYLYSFDASLHMQLPFLVGRLMARSLPFALVSFFVYLGLPVGVGLIFAGCLMRDRKNALRCFLALFVTGGVGVIFYNLFPALGPAHLFRDSFPGHPLTTEQARRLFLQPVALPGYRNAIPSLHAAWMYLVVWYSRKLTILERVVAVFFLFFTLCYTMGSGEHYFIDLIVAAPFTVGILALTNLIVTRRRAVLVPLLTGLGLTLAWLAALRFALGVFWLSPVVPWTICVVTLVLSGWFGRKLLLFEEQANSATIRLGDGGQPMALKSEETACVPGH